MTKDTRDRVILAAIGLITGVFLILEGLQVTRLGTPSGNTPYWVVTAAGAAFFVAGVAVLMGDAGKWNDLAAAMITALMGCIAGWISLFADESGMAGNGMVLVQLTGIPIHRIAFGAGSLLCFLVSLYAFRGFIRKRA